MTSNVISERLEGGQHMIFGLFPLLLILVYVGGIIAAFAVAIAIWRGMKAHERLADSLERIEKMVEHDRTQR
jgi:hypothetical protein